jgi:hypothetical protein
VISSQKKDRQACLSVIAIVKQIVTQPYCVIAPLRIATQTAPFPANLLYFVVQRMRM